MKGVLLATMLVVALGGCQTVSGRTMGRWVDDHTITTRVRTRLAALRGAPFTHVTVDTYNGTVYLSGIAGSDEIKQRAEALASTVRGVTQVVPNLEVHREPVAASPRTEVTLAGRAMPGTWLSHTLLAKVPGIQLVTGDPIAHPEGPFAAYDHEGRLVATIYTMSMRDLAERGAEDLVGVRRRIDHVTIEPVSGEPDVPVPHYHIVLWHVSPAHAATVR